MSAPTPAPTDRYAEIADRLRRGKTVDQLADLGERTGWWTGEDVDWVYDGHTGPRPRDADEPTDVVEFVLQVAGPELQEIAELSAASRARAAVPAAEVRPVDILFGAADRELPGGPEAAPAGPYVAVLRVDELFVDHSYQRPLDNARVRRMATAWSPRLVGLLDVSDRGPDTDPVNRYAIVNGQHRAAAAVRAGVTHMACNIHEDLDVPAEAQLMAELDRTTKKLSGHDQWRARRGAGDPAVATVERIAAAHGLTVAPQLADGVLRAYGAAEKLLQQGGEQLLDNTLGVLRGAYGMTAAAWQAPLVSGVGQLLRLHPGVDVARLTRALADTSPTQLRAHATSAREIDGGTLAEAVTRVAAGLHNRTSGPGPRISGGRG